MNDILLNKYNWEGESKYAQLTTHLSLFMYHQEEITMRGRECTFMGLEIAANIKITTTCV